MTWSALALELLAAPLALVKRLRPWVWLALLAMHLGLIVLIDFVDLSVGMLIIHAFTFDPAWLPPRERSQPLWLFYDGTCGLCHGAVRSVLAEDRTGIFRFAPIGGEAFVARVGDQVARTLPDSIVLQTASGELLTRSAAVRAVLDELGGLWRVVAVGMGLVPRAISDFFYDRVASVRRRLFRAPRDVCPVMPSELRTRFAS
jgi:predicted DCC family thiol-disulfide oxidoreductase YuxK